MWTPYRGLRAQNPQTKPRPPRPPTLSYQPHHRENQDIAFPCLPHFPTYSRTFLSLGGMCRPLLPQRNNAPLPVFLPRSKKYFVGQFVARISYLESCPPWVAAKRSIDEKPPLCGTLTPLLPSISKPPVSIYWPSKGSLHRKVLLRRRIGMFVGAIFIIRKPLELL